MDQKLPAGYQAVESSNVAAIGFFEMVSGKSFLGTDELAKAAASSRFGRLEVMFKNGDRWAYSTVPADFVREMLLGSVGKYLNTYIKTKPEAFPATKLERFVEV